MPARAALDCAGLSGHVRQREPAEEEAQNLASHYSQCALESIPILYVPYLKAYIISLNQEWRQWVGEWQAERAQGIRERLAFLIQGACVPEG